MADSSHLNDAMAQGSSEVDHATTVEVPTGHGDAHGDHGDSGSLIAPDAQMVILTWITFGIVAALLYKIAWKPILTSLEAREGKIRKSVDDAEAARKALDEIEHTRKKIIAETQKETKSMIASAREEAAKAASLVEAGAHDKVKIMYENAERDIDALKNKAISELRREQAGLVLSLAGRLVSENLDTDKNRKLTDRLIAQL